MAQNGGVVTPEMAEEQKKYQEEMEKKQAEFKALLESPLDEDEGKRMLAENDVQRCRCRAFIEQHSLQMDELSLKINKVRMQMTDLDGEDAIIRRRMLNKKA